MEFKNSEIRMWSMLGPRGTFGVALEKMRGKYEDVIALSADLCNTSGLDRFAAKYPDSFLNVGIAEQNLLGVAAGTADYGKIPFATTFANFAALRACEMVRHFMGYMCCNIKLVGLGAGFAMEYFGTTHYGIEDISAIRSIPNIVILSPADGLEVVKCVEAAVLHKGPVYLRLTGVMNQPIVHKKDFDFQIGKAVELAEGDDVAVIATGSMVAEALEAARILREKRIGCKVIDMTTIKPIDQEAVQKCMNMKLLVTVEEHNVVGGLGSSVTEASAMLKGKCPVQILGAKGYKKAGDYSYMLGVHGLTPEKIAKQIEDKYRRICNDID